MALLKWAQIEFRFTPTLGDKTNLDKSGHQTKAMFLPNTVKFVVSRHGSLRSTRREWKKEQEEFLPERDDWWFQRKELPITGDHRPNWRRRRFASLRSWVKTKFRLVWNLCFSWIWRYTPTWTGYVALTCGIKRVTNPKQWIRGQNIC